jgi:hypothetical protein
MGAEQVGYLVKGPDKISARMIEAAVRRCLDRRRMRLDQAGEGATSGQRADTALAETGEEFDPADIPENPEPVIRDFVAWWRGLDGRDTCCRTDPDDPRQKLVFAGEMSWGDEPQGQGYQMLKRAFDWGFAEALGIR